LQYAGKQAFGLIKIAHSSGHKYRWQKRPCAMIIRQNGNERSLPLQTAIASKESR
jgi:hypothetical protein